MPISFHRPLRLLSRQHVHEHPSSSPPSAAPTPSATRKSPPRRSRPRCLPCVGPPAPPHTPPPLRRPGFEHVDDASFPPLPLPASSRCACELDHARVPTLPDDHHLSTPRDTPLQPTANRPPTPSAHALSGLLPPAASSRAAVPHHLPHTPLPSPSNRHLHVHAANLVSQLPESVSASAGGRRAPPADFSIGGPPGLSYDHGRRAGRSAPDSATRRRQSEFVRRSQDTAFAAAGSRSVQFHDFNSNTMVLVTLGDSVEVTAGGDSTMHGQPAGSDTSHSHTSSSGSSSSTGTGTGTGSGGSSPAQSESEHAASSQEDGGEVGLPVMVVGSEDNSDAGDGSDDLRESSVTDDDSKVALEKKLAAGSPTEIIKRALSTIKAARGPRHFELSDDAYGVVMRALQRVLAQSSARSDCLSDVHPDDRTEVHYLLAKFQTTLPGEWSEARAETMLHHCREGLFLMHGRERMFPRMAAELHALAGQVLLLPRDPKKVQSVLPAAVKHLNDARVAMYAFKEADQELAFEISLFTAAAHVLSNDEPICDNLLQAYMAYKAAEDMLRMGDINRGPDWIKLGCHQLQVMLRFLTHKRSAAAGKRVVCSRTESAACRREHTGTESLSDLTADAVVARAEGLRFKVTRHFEVNPEELDGDAEKRQVVCSLHESVARAYLERAAVKQDKRVHDLKKAAVNIDRALGSCAWVDDFSGQKYATLRELAENVQEKIEAIERNAPAQPEGGSEDSGNISSETEWESEA